MARTVISNGNLVMPRIGVIKADLVLDQGKILSITSDTSQVEADQRIDAEDKFVFPGVIDCHTHFGMGSKETDYATESVSALVGGVTTVISYELQSTPYEDTFESWRAHAQSQSFVDFGFHYGMVTDQQINSFEVYCKDQGVSSFKFFMNFRGEEGAYLGLLGIDDGVMYDLFKKAGMMPSTVVAVHPENIEVVWRKRKEIEESGRNDLRAWDECRPDFVEAENIRRAMYFAEFTGAKLYIPHISCGMGLNEALEYRKRYKKIFLETCPHYLTHFSNDPLEEKGKVNPPLRSSEDAKVLWQGLIDGSIDVVASDHVPRTLDKKRGGIWKASAGFPGCATILPVLLSEGYHKRGLSLERISELVTYNPAKIFNLSDKKGNISVGLDADLTIVDLNREELISSAKLQSNAGYSLYEGWTVKGWVEQTLVRGDLVMKEGRLVKDRPQGCYLMR